MQIDFSGIKEGPVLRPSLNEFKDFRKYIHSIETCPELADCGIVKVGLTRSFLHHLLEEK